MKKRMTGLIICLLFVMGVILLYEKVSHEKNDQEMTDTPIRNISNLKTKTTDEDLNPDLESAESNTIEGEDSCPEPNVFTTEEKECQEPDLVEIISNPLLFRWTKLGDFVPFVSYAEAMDSEGQVYVYAPLAGSDDLEEIKAWGEDILYDLVLHPENVEEYGAVLTFTSVEAWEAFQWIYSNPEDYYCYKYTDGSNSDDSEYMVFITWVGVPRDYFIGDADELDALDRTQAEGISQELLDYTRKWGDIGIEIGWFYEKKTGLIQINAMNYYRLGGR